MYIYVLCVQLLVHVCHAMCLEIRDQFPGAGSGLLPCGGRGSCLCMLTAGCLAIFRAGLLPLPPSLPLERWDCTCMLPNPGLFACLLASFVGSGLQTWALSLCSRQQAFLPTESSSWPSDCFCDDFISFSFNFCLDREERHLPVVRSTASRCFSFPHRPRLWLLSVGCLTPLQWKMTRFVLQSSELINGI